MVRLLNKFLAGETGATAIEYAVIAMIMGLGIISSLRAMPVTMNAVMSDTAAEARRELTVPDAGLGYPFVKYHRPDWPAIVGVGGVFVRA